MAEYQALAMKPKKIRLFVKTWCGWCDEVIDWLEERGIDYEKLDVNTSADSMREMIALSGQSRAPVIEADSEVLADFGAEELEAWWNDRGFNED